jgi:4-hydroxy-tetrahydrodipicolinate synthase
MHKPVLRISLRQGALVKRLNRASAEDEMSINWQGVFFVSPTQFRSDQTIDLEGTQRVVEGLVKDGAHGIIMLGRFGEVISMTSQEKRQVLSAAKEVIQGRVPLLAGAIECNVESLVAYARDLERLGVDGLMATPLLGYPPRPHEGLHLVKQLAAASGLPIMLYNEPIGFGLDYTPQLLNQLSDVKTLVAIKESTDLTRRVTEIFLACRNRFLVFCGQDDIIFESMMLGCVGWVCATGCVFARESVVFHELIKAKRYDEARDIYRWMYPVLHLDNRSTFIQCGKLALQVCGRGSEMVRLPLMPLQGSERAEVIAVVENAQRSRPVLPSLDKAA